MRGRGARGNHLIFNEINEFMENGEVKTHLSELQRLQYMKEHIELLIRLKGEHVGIREARKHIAWYTKGMHGGSTMRAEVFKTENYDKLMNIIEQYSRFLSERGEVL